jgi:hypothetical protein
MAAPRSVNTILLKLFRFNQDCLRCGQYVTGPVYQSGYVSQGYRGSCGLEVPAGGLVETGVTLAEPAANSDGLYFGALM